MCIRDRRIVKRHPAVLNMRAVGRLDNTDDRRQMRGEGPRVFLALGRRVGLFNRRVFIERVEREVDDVGAIEAVAEARGGEEVGGLFPAAVDVPADQILAAGRGHVIARGCPGHPRLGVAVDEQREQLPAVRPAKPADRTVAIGRDNNSAVSREIHAPGNAGGRPLPNLPALSVEGAQMPLGTKDKAGRVGANGDRKRPFVLFERDRLAGKCWVEL